MSAAWDLPFAMAFDGQQVRYGAMGEGPALVLIHGTPFSSAVWRRIAPHLAARRRVFWFDLLGYGCSEMREGQDVSLGIQNRVLGALLDHWGVARPDVVAHDFGGATALRAHLLNGCDFRTLTLIDPVAIAPWGSPFVRHVRDHQAAFAALPAYIHAATLDAYIGGAVHRRLAPDDLSRYAAPWQGPAGQAAFYRQIAQMDQRYTDAIAPLLGSVRCPVTVLWGAEDAWIPLAQGRRLAALLADPDFRVVPGAGHLVQEDAPEAIVAAVLDRLAAEPQ